MAADIPIYNKAWGGWLTVGRHQRRRAADRGHLRAGRQRRLVTARDLYRHAAASSTSPGATTCWFGTPKAACGDDYLCTAKRGYDAPTGLGTPDGIGGF